MTDKKELTPEAFVTLLHQFALDLLQRSTLDEIFWLIADRVIAGIGFEDCVIYLLDYEKKILIQKAAYGPKNPEGRTIKDAITIPMGEGIVGSVALNAKPERIPDTRLDPRYIVSNNPPFASKQDVYRIVSSVPRNSLSLCSNFWWTA